MTSTATVNTVTILNALIVDDEDHSRRRLKRMLEQLGNVRVVGEAANGDQALVMIRETRPDVVFLDICMPGLDGMTLVCREPNLPPIIFVTAHNEYAVQAFDAAAVDYLLKPVSDERLAQSVERLRARGGISNSAQLADLLRGLIGDQLGRASPRVVAQDRDRMRIFDANTIARFCAADKYVIFWHEGREMLLDESLSMLESRLPAETFMRVHRGEIVNLRLVKALVRDGETMVLELSDGQKVPVSRRVVPDLKERFGLRR